MQNQIADARKRARDFLGESEINRFLAAAKRGRHGVPDHLLLLLKFRHGVRFSEAIALRRSDANLDQARLWFSRLKNGLSVGQPLAGDELRAVHCWLASRDDVLPLPFVSERRQPLTRQAVNYIVARAGERAGLGHIHPHMLWLSCGFALADKGYDLHLIQDYLGHRDPSHIANYARTAANRFEGIW